jgi:hypothetical protein
MPGLSCGRKTTDAATFPNREATLTNVCRLVDIVGVGPMGLVVVRVDDDGVVVTPDNPWVDTSRMVVRDIGRRVDRFMVRKEGGNLLECVGNVSRY